jgi:2,3-diketo-5-methylthio-1-phosphopentane phosphatase
MARVRLPACIVLDIEGTTTSLRFIKDVLFPYIKRSLARYLRERWQTEEVIATMARLIRQEERDISSGLSPPKIWKLTETSDLNKIIDSVVSNVIWQMDLKRHNTALKQLQILVWVYGYENNELKGHVYDDVGTSFRRWRSMGIRLFAYSTGMAVAQQLLFSNSSQGNLLNMIENYFDVLVGQKTNPDSFKKIAWYMNVTTTQMLFITDTPDEGRAAKNAGCQVVLVQRPENRRLSMSLGSEFPIVSNLNHIEFS